MTIRHLEVFISVCKNMSMTKAAEELFIAQPAVSKSISEIESTYNVVLFERINKRLVLTDEGKAILMKAKEVVSSFKEFEELAINSSAKSVVKIGSSLTFGKQYMPDLLRLLKTNFNNVNFQISINQTSLIESEISNGTLDFAFIQASPTDPNIYATPVDKTRMIAVCGVGYNIPDKVTLAELCEYDLLVREKESVSREFLDRIFADASIFSKPIMESASNQAIVSAAIQNLGVAILPEELIEKQIKKKRLKKITVTDKEFIRTSYLIHHKSKSFTPTKKQVFDFAYDNFRV